MGLGAGLAGLSGPDPGAEFASGPSHASVRVSGHDAPLWLVKDGSAPADSCAVFAGEVAGGWVWLVLWPDSAGLMLVETLALLDLRDTAGPLGLPFGAQTTRLPAA